MLRNKRGRDSERPAHRDEEWPPLAATRGSPRRVEKREHQGGGEENEGERDGTREQEGERSEGKERGVAFSGTSRALSTQCCVVATKVIHVLPSLVSHFLCSHTSLFPPLPRHTFIFSASPSRRTLFNFDTSHPTSLLSLLTSLTALTLLFYPILHLQGNFLLEIGRASCRERVSSPV